ncbi:Pep3/Vps18/deep orange family-domain-containing protein [Scheffersomyces coipomensis]|uniref:Pep3/Vps18/deep orange family-domain-containing protein n=1 Tax=Scheffersomyces coipomensis TaxID=1788519 RepID=UPI00315D09CA
MDPSINGKDLAPSINSESTSSFNNYNGNGTNGDGVLASNLTTTNTSSTTNTFENDHEKPSFSIETVQLQFDLSHGLINLLVSNNIMFLILVNSVIRIDLDNPSEIKKYQVPTISNISNLSITNNWLHPNGSHLIIQVNHIHYFYLHSSYTQFKLLPRFKNLNIVVIAFPTTNNDNITDSAATTGEFIIAVKECILYSALIKSHDFLNESNKRDDKYIKQIYKHPSSNGTLHGLTFTNNNSQINIFINDTVYIWDCFDSSYAELINVFKNKAQKMIELPKTSKPIFSSNYQDYIYIDPSTNEFQSNDVELILSDIEKLPTSHTHLSPTANIVITPHHLITLDHDNDNLLIFNKLNPLDLIELPLNKYTLDNDKIIGILADYKLNTYWLYSSNFIYELIISNESISIWYNYYKMGKYDEALKCLEESPDTNYYKLDLILIKQGYDYLQRGGFGSIDYDYDDTIDQSLQALNEDELLELQVKGIKKLGKSSEPFEKVCLMLLNLQQQQQQQKDDNKSFSSKTSVISIVSQILLVEYLLVKFSIAKDVEKNKIRIIILSSWIIELMSRTIYVLNDDLQTKTNNDENLKVKTFKQRSLQTFETNFKSFLASNYKILDREVVYQIMMELNLSSKFIYFAELIEDFKFILNYYININDWDNSIKTIIKLYTSTIPHKIDIIYKTSVVLLINCPQLIVNVWLKFNEQDVNYENFLPAILIYNKNIDNIKLLDNYSIKFLNKLIFDKGIKSKQLNNYYLSLLITYPHKEVNNSTKQILKFLHFIRNELNANSKLQLYDANFILRLCLNHNQYEAAILILIHDMKLYDSALKLSLDNDLPELGQFVLQEYDRHHNDNQTTSTANTNNEEDFIVKTKLEEETFSSRKKLWISFSKYVITKVCNGEKIDLQFVDSEEEEEVEKEKEKDDGETIVEEKGKSNSNGVHDLTQSLVNDIVGKKDEDLEKADHLAYSSQKLNEVLKYILKLSKLNNSDNSGVIGLKDLLPLFPESIMINNFKDEIVKSLNEYNNKINHLSLEMNESLTISHNLKQQIKDANNLDHTSKLYSIIEPGEPCQICLKLLITKNFIYFPNCHHGHHKDCLIRNYLTLKNDYRFKKIFNNFKRNPNSSVNKQELNDILTKSCILCNDGNINLIDLGLIDPERDQSDIGNWEL